MADQECNIKYEEDVSSQNETGGGGGGDNSQQQQQQQQQQQDFTSDNFNGDNSNVGEYSQNDSYQADNTQNSQNGNYENNNNNNSNSEYNTTNDNINNNNSGINNDQNENDNENDEENAPEPEQYRKLFIGSLNYSTSEETMRNYFGKFGDIVDCVIMKEPKTGKSRGFGFVTYSKSFMVDEVMKNRPHKLDGRELETKRATPREEAGKPGAELTTKKLFVGAIKEGLTEDHLKEYFSPYGNITDCVIMREKDTNKSRGFGFVSFDDYDPVDKIVLEKYHTINGQSVAVKKALPKDQATKNRGGGYSGGNSGGAGNYDEDNFSGNFGNFNFNNLPNNFAQMAQKMFQAAAMQNFGKGGSRQMNFTADDFEGFQGFGGKGGSSGGPMRGGNKFAGRSGGPYGGGRKNNNNNNNNNPNNNNNNKNNANKN